MNESHLQRVLEGILSSQSFELLSNFRCDESWSALLPEEKELLAQLFLLSAEASLRSGETVDARSKARQAYQSACRLLPTSAKVWYRLGAFLALEEKETDLQEAIAALRKAIDLDAGFFDAHYALASASLRLGVVQKQPALLLQAERSFSQAADSVGHQHDDSVSFPGEFFWHWGLAWFLLAKDSGEPCDLKRAIELYQKALQKGLTRSEFFNDYANALVELSLLISNDNCVFAAIPLYEEAVESSDGEYPKEKAVRLFNLGCCYQHVFEASSERKYFESADKAFSESTAICPDLPFVWPRWGQLLFRASRLWCDGALAEMAISRLRTAEERGVKNPLILALIAQGLAWVGEEQGDVLAVALDYANRSLALQTQLDTRYPDVWAALAMCQYAFGRYFQETSFFETCVQILQKGLTEHPKSAILWHLLGLTKVAFAEMTDSARVLKESLVCFLLTSHSSYANFPMFWNDWGLALLSLGDATGEHSFVTEAIGKFEKAVALVDAKNTAWMFNLARAHELLGDLTDEEESYERAITIFSELLADEADFPEAAHRLAVCYLHLGEIRGESDSFAMAVSLIEDYLEKDPEDEAAWADYGIALIHKGLKERSGRETPKDLFSGEEALLRAISLGNEQAIYHLGCLYALLRNFPEAMNKFHEALAQDAVPPVSDIREDEWLEEILLTAPFEEFLRQVEERDRQEG
jgi:tetratricopeptide (TPR) repeat protein